MRIYYPAPRDLQIRHLRRRFGLTHRQAEVLASWCFGEGSA
ncbi:hypothetical protein [Tropicimonas sp. IMCC6043]|nr:hypothetical protein [Tropicimonas sp. IMCC6043]